MINRLHVGVLSMLDYVIVALTAGTVGMLCGTLGSIHYIVTHPQEFQDKVEEELYT